MNTTRTVTVPLALAAACTAALAVMPQADVSRILPDAGAFVERVTAAVVGAAFDLASSLPALGWVLVGFGVTLLVAALLSMDWEAHTDEHEGFDIR